MRKKISESDEKMLFEILSDGKQKTVRNADGPENRPEASPEPAVRRRRVCLPDYDDILFSRTTVDRNGRVAIYVNEHTHATLVRIIARLTEGRVYISSYVENIILAHFDLYRDEINKKHHELYKDEII